MEREREKRRVLNVQKTFRYKRERESVEKLVYKSHDMFWFLMNGEVVLKYFCSFL